MSELKFPDIRERDIDVVGPYDDWTHVNVKSFRCGEYVFTPDKVALKPGKLFVLDENNRAVSWAGWERCRFYIESFRHTPQTEDDIPELQ